MLFTKYKQQYRRNLALAFPIVLTQLGQILTQVADNLMVGQYGGENPVPLAAVSFGGMVFFILFITTIGVAMGMTPLIGELYVQDDKKRSSALLQNGIAFYLLLGIAITILQYASTPLLYHLGQPIEIVEMAIPYYRMLSLSMPFMMIFFAFKQFLEGVGNTRAELYVTIIANICNFVLNWVLIYGNLGAPEMGTEGAGLATLIARISTPILIFSYFIYFRRYRMYLKEFALRHFSRVSVRRLLQMGLPISMQMFLESSAFVGIGIMMGWFGTESMSANQITITLGNCAFMIVISIGAATTIRVSHCYGRNNIDELALAAKASYHLVLIWNSFAALIFITMRHIIPTMFTENALVIEITSTLLIFASLYQLSDGLQNVSVGILRGLQDVKIIMPIAFIAYWLLNLPIGYVLAFVLGMGPSGLYLSFFFGLSTAALLMILRIRRDIHRLKAATKTLDKV